LAAWFDEWGAMVAQVKPDSARALFAEDVFAFGTFMDFVDGLNDMAQKQWVAIWPTIEDFRFETENLRAVVSKDRLSATAAVVWTSTGIDRRGQRYDRPGRATVAVVRDTVSSPWQGVHTHFSEFPRETKRSFGERPIAG
jgi:ketosteroid isomerase-like protein